MANRNIIEGAVAGGAPAATVSVRIGRASLDASLTSAGLLSVGVLVSGILLSSAVIVFVAGRNRQAR